MKYLHKISFTLLFVGGLNWLLWGLFEWEIGSLLGGNTAMAAKVVYILVGLAAIFEIATHAGRCKECKMNSSGSGSSENMPPTTGGQPQM